MLRDYVPEIIYIMGTARSGTTILEILLSNNPGIVGCGELTYIFRDGFTGKEICSCGKKACECEFWQAVKNICSWEEEDILRFARLFYSMDWHHNFPAVALKIVSPNKLRQYIDVNRSLFQAIHQASGVRVIVDSSKYAARALLLNRAFPDKVKVLCMTRSPAGLIRSFQKKDAEEQKPKSIVNIIAYYIYVLLCLRVVAWSLGPKMLKITYEELATNPQETLLKIEKWCGYDLSSVRNKIRSNEWLNVGHIVTGNRLRKKGRIQFQPEIGSIKLLGRTNLFAMRIMDLVRVVLRF